MKLQILFAFGLAVLSASFAASAGEGRQGFVRVEAGRSNLELDVAGDPLDDDDTSYGLRGGYFFTRYLAVEGFYMRYGEISHTIESLGFQTSSRIKFDGYGVGIVAKKNFGESDLGFFVDARLGVTRTKAELRGRTCSTVTQECETFDGDDASTDPYLGVGVGYDFSPFFGVGLNYNRTKGDGELFGDEQDVTLTSLALSMEYRF